MEVVDIRDNTQRGRQGEIFITDVPLASGTTQRFFFVQGPFTQRRKDALTPAGQLVLALLQEFANRNEVFSARFGVKSFEGKPILSAVQVGFSDNADPKVVGQKIIAAISRA